MGLVADLNNGRSNLTQEGTTALVGQLSDWLRNLPDELHLYDTSDMRRPFYRPVCDLHITYFATIILLQLLDRKRAGAPVSSSSLTAASCIARLYEEIHYREETAHLVSVHGFLCMVAAVPLIVFPPSSPERRLAQEEDLEIIRNVLVGMRARYGGSDLVLRKISKLQQDVRRGGREQGRDCHVASGEDALWATRSIQERSGELFAFPPSFCPRMSSPEPDTSHLGDSGGDWMAHSDSISDFLSGNDLNLSDIVTLDYSFLAMPNDGSLGF